MNSSEVMFVDYVVVCRRWDLEEGDREYTYKSIKKIFEDILK